MDPENEKAPPEGAQQQQNDDKENDEPGRSPAETSLVSKLAKEMKRRKYTEKVLDSRHQELEAHEAEKKQLKAQVDALQKELASTQRQLSEARATIKSRSRQLQDVKEQVFNLQPRRNDITEAEAREGYRSLCSSVQRWVGNRITSVLDQLDQGRVPSRPPALPATRFIGLTREPARRCLTVAQSDEFHVTAVITNYLWLAMFSKSFYCPLDDTSGDGTGTWIDQLEGTMFRLPRDVAHCREWRSETLAAITHQSNFKTRRARHLGLIADDLASLLSVLSPKAVSSDFHSSIRRSIIEPAADLAHQLHLAASIFSLKWPAKSAATRLEVYECVNLASGGQVLDLAGTNPASPARRNVSYLFDVSPGLFVERVEGGKKLGARVIARPTVLVHGADGAVPQSQTVAKWLWDCTGGPHGPGRNANVRMSGPRRSAASVASTTGRAR